MEHLRPIDVAALLLGYVAILVIGACVSLVVFAALCEGVKAVKRWWQRRGEIGTGR